MPSTSHVNQGRLRRFFRLLGPGLITGAADDDPSGVGTYSIAGAQMGYGLLWMAAVAWPLMAATQMMCARIGMVTGHGLGESLRRKFPRWLVAVAAFALLGANTLNIGADLSAMADAAHMLIGISGHIWVVVFAVAIAWATVRFRYRQLAAVLKWLALSLMAYVIAAFLAHPHWKEVMHGLLVPAVEGGRNVRTTLVALLGTSISPYLFFWQTAQEVEESRSRAPRMKVPLERAADNRMRDRRIDVAVGTLAASVVMFFIMLTCAATLHAAGKTHIESTKEAAAALKPLAGHAAMLLYTLGLVGVGLLAIPTLSGSAAYALGDVFDWPSSLDKRPKGARWFYAVIVGSTVCGVAIDFAGVNPVHALYLSAVVNGILSPFLLCGILAIAADRQIMKSHRPPAITFACVALTALAMFAAAVGMWF